MSHGASRRIGSLVVTVVALAAGGAAASIAGSAFGASGQPAVQLPPPAFSFSNGSPDGRMAMASRPGAGGKIEIEAADDVVLGDHTSMTGATFTGLLPSAASLASIADVRVEIYRVFPNDSTNPPSGHVLTRANSPSDVAFASRDTAAGSLTFVAVIANSNFTASNSVLNGINKLPNQMTGGEGGVSGEEVSFTVTFTTPLDLPADHYFFVPQVQLSSGDFYWLSASGPGPSPDLQTWIRNANLDPDWSRVGTDIVGGTTKFNGSFSLNGSVVCPAIAISPPALPAATLGAPYSATISASGGTGPFSFSETGALPAGLSLAAGGALAGTPTQSGAFPVTVKATAANGCAATAPMTVTVTAPTTTITTTTTTISTSTTTVQSTAKATLSALRVTPSSFTAAHGAVVSFRLDRPARVRLTFNRTHPGRRGKQRRCEPPSRTNRHGRRCTRTTLVRGGLTVSGKAGSNRVPFRRPKLAPGTYVVVASPIPGTAQRAGFRIRRPIKRK